MEEKEKKKESPLFWAVVIVLIAVFAGAFIAGIILKPINWTSTQQTEFNKTITVKMLSPTGSDLGVGIFATDGNGYLAYPQDKNITTGEQNITVNGTYDIIYHFDNTTRFRIISNIVQNKSRT